METHQELKEKLAQTIESAIEIFSYMYPELYSYCNDSGLLEGLKAETGKVAYSYADRLEVMGKDSIISELQGHLKKAEEIFSTGVSDTRDNGLDFAAQNTLLGMLEIAWIRAIIEAVSIDETLSLENIFRDEQAKDLCFQAMEDIGLILQTNDGKIEKTRKPKGAELAAVYVTLKETPGLLRIDKPTERALLGIFNRYFGTNHVEPEKASNKYKESKDLVERRFRNTKK